MPSGWVLAKLIPSTVVSLGLFPGKKERERDRDRNRDRDRERERDRGRDRDRNRQRKRKRKPRCVEPARLSECWAGELVCCIVFFLVRISVSLYVCLLLCFCLLAFLHACADPHAPHPRT